MATIVNIFSQTIGKKLIMALTGLFLILFLTGHLVGNLILIFVDDGGLAFNEYAKFMTTSPIVKVLSYTTYISIIFHVIFSIVLTMYNRKARPVKYEYNKPSENSVWTSRNMGILGTIILIFLVIHLRSFWYEMHFGGIQMMDGHPDLKDLYPVVTAAFDKAWYVILYVLSMVMLGFHLSHGFQSAFQTLGLNNESYSPLIQKLGLGYAIVVPALFAIIPIYLYFT